MSNETIQRFYVVGISTRISNENGNALDSIEKLWGKFWSEDILNKIPDRIDDDIYAVYADYESDYAGPYTMIIGYRVSSLDTIPEGRRGISIETGMYRKFVSKGKMPQAVIDTWMQIWQNKSLNRAYKADFTVHGKKYYDGDNAEVETYISVKE